MPKARVYGPHVHYVLGKTSVEEGHSHEIRGLTEPVSFSADAGHEHRVLLTSTIADGHCHRVELSSETTQVRFLGHSHRFSGLTEYVNGHSHTVELTTRSTRRPKTRLPGTGSS